MTEPAEPIVVLLVEDDAGDELMTREALEDHKLANALHVVRDGEQALSFLFRRDPYADAPRPDLILLDLNLPRKDGRQVLAELKSDATLAQIPVVVLSTSDADTDILNAYSLHANCYVAKPVELDAFFDAMRAVEQFWLSVAVLPAREVPDA